MAYIDKISVNGSERDLRDVGAARFDETQALTDAQKQAARVNVGAASAADVTALTATVATKADAVDVTALAGHVTTAEGDIDDLEAAVDTKADAADVTALTTVVAGKVDKQQGVSYAGKALVVGAEGAVTLGDAGVPAAVAETLLACFRKVAWVDTTGQTLYDALYAALYSGPQSVEGWYYPFDGDILSRGTKEFNFSGDSQFGTGKVGQAYYKPSGTYGICQLVTTPIVFAGDFTIALWFREPNGDANCGIFDGSNILGTGNVVIPSSENTTLYNGWTYQADTMYGQHYGIRLIRANGHIDLRMGRASDLASNGWCVRLIPPSSFDNTAWHHYAVTRSNGTVRLFIDGNIIAQHTNYTIAFQIDNRIMVGEAFAEEKDGLKHGGSANHSVYVDDLYVSNTECKWMAAFDPEAISY